MSFDYNTLTSKQKKVYSAIESFIKLKGIPPTVREIGELVGEKTPGAVQGILNRLEQKGAIKREIGMARSIQLVSDDSKYLKPFYVPELKKISSRTIDDLFSIYNISKYHPLSPDIAASADSCFMIRCHTEDLSSKGIVPGDLLLVKMDTELANGDVILALYGNHTLLRIYQTSEQPDMLCLNGENTIISKSDFSRNEIVIIGKLIGKYTKY